MKLQNIQSQYIHEVGLMATKDKITLYSYTDGHFYEYESLEKLTKEWKDL